MDNHKEITRQIDKWSLEGPLERGIELLRAEAAGLKDPQLKIDLGYDSYDLCVRGWYPMSQEEINRVAAKKKAARLSSRIARSKKKEQDHADFLAKAKRLGYVVSKEE